jgi:multiple antibiotic resistance protein
MEIAGSFLQIAFASFVALFPPVNPLGTALLVDPLLRRRESSARRAAAARVALYCLAICLGTALLGSWLLTVFGISLPVVQVGGGLLIAHMGWQLLNAAPVINDASGAVPSQAEEDGESKLFYPVAFPMTTGPGTITVLLTLSAHGHLSTLTKDLVNIAALSFASLLICLVIFICYAYTPLILRWLNTRGHQMVGRLSAFLVFCVGLQIALEGLTQLAEPFMR